MIDKSVVPFNTYTPADEVTVLFNATFPTFELDSVIVLVTLLSDETETVLTSGVDFVPANLGVNGINASFTLIDAGQLWIDAIGGGLDNLYSITIKFDPSAFQPGSFRSLGNYSPITLEQVFDRLTMTIKAIEKLVTDALADLAQAIIDIATNAADIATNVIDIATNATDIAALETFLYSTKEVIANNSTVALSDTIDETVYEGMVFEYWIKRGGVFQYGRELIMDNSPFGLFQLEKVGNAGVTFTIAEAGGVGTISYTSTNTVAGTIQYRTYKFTI